MEVVEAFKKKNPDDAEAHQALGEALIEGGDRARGIEELDHATMGFESLGELARAHVLVDFFFSSRRRHTRSLRDWSSDVCSSDLSTTTARLPPIILSIGPVR